MKLILAGVVAVASLFSPVATVVSSAALAIDCTNPAAPESRPGGYCDQISPGATLNEPVDPAPELKEMECNAMLPDNFFLTPGVRIEVAAICCDCG